MSCLALFMALSGVAFAATAAKNSVKAKSIARGAVTTPKLKNGAVKAGKLAKGAVISVKLANGAVVGAKIANGVVGGGKLANGAVGTSKLANNAVATGKVAGNAISTGKLQDGAVTSAKLAPSFLAQLTRNVSYVTKESPSNADDEPKSATAECPAGKQVTGGGALVKGADVELVALTESAPVLGTDGRRTAWRATAREINPEASAWSVEAYAICAEL